MEENKAKEEILKDKIFSCFFNSLNEPNRQQTFLGQISDLIFRWCRDYLNFNVDDMGLEIFNITKRFLKDDSKANIPKDRDDFIKYLLSALKTGKTEYKRNYESKNKDDVVRMQESYLGRKLSEDEKDNVITKWFEHEVAEGPSIDYLINSNIDIIREAVKAALERKQDRSRDCYKALFTLHCIGKKHTEGLFSILDHDIITGFQKDDKIPTQYEIWQKYHPDALKSSSEVQASINLNNFLRDLEKYLKEKNPEIFH
ncbi:MAG: hypothetical protein FWC21_04560 [Treponema sp.]|nr:hypothetical protein [Treponema sp.]